MFGKLRTKHLLLLVVALAALWWLSGHFSASAQQRTFREVIMKVDTGSVDSFTIIPAKFKRVPDLRFRRVGMAWQLVMGNDTTIPDDAPVHELLASISDMRTVRLAGRMTEVKDRYELSDSLTDRLVINAADGQHTLLVGRATSSEDAMTVVCPIGDEDAYAVQGRLGEITDKSFGDWMPKYLVRGDPANWRRLTFNFPGDTGYVMERHGTRWTIDGAPTDPSRVAHYLGSLARSRGQSLADPRDTLQAIPAFTLVVEDTTRAVPIAVVVYGVQGRFIVRSSLNPASVMPFDGKNELPRMFRPRSAYM